jgi:IS4 transposase
MGYDSLRLELRYRHIWQTKWGTGAGSVAANQVSILFILLLLFVQLIVSIVVKQGQYYFRVSLSFSSNSFKHVSSLHHNSILNILS